VDPGGASAAAAAAEGAIVLAETALVPAGGGDSAPSRKRPLPLGPEAGAIEPARKQHSGMFREQTIQGVLCVKEKLRSVVEDRDVAAIVEVLEELADYVVDERVLSKTKIGIDVGALQKHPAADVATRARALVVQWKRDRENRLKVVNSFVNKAKLSEKDARKMEEGLFNAACPLGYLEGEGFKAYHQHFMRISTHLRTQGPNSLLERLQAGELSPAEVASLPDDALLSDAQRERALADRQAGLREALAGQGAEPDGTVTSEYMCPKCQSSRCLYRDVQTGWHNDQQDVTILVQCLDCGERWKANDDHGLGGS